MMIGIAQVPDITNENVYRLVATTFAGAAIVLVVAAIGFLALLFRRDPPKTDREEHVFNRLIWLGGWVAAGAFVLGGFSMFLQLPAKKARDVVISVQPDEAVSLHGVKVSRGSSDLSLAGGRASLEVREHDQLDVMLYSMVKKIDDLNKIANENQSKSGMRSNEGAFDDPK